VSEAVLSGIMIERLIQWSAWAAPLGNAVKDLFAVDIGVYVTCDR
jgi:hypothetical protein